MASTSSIAQNIDKPFPNVGNLGTPQTLTAAAASKVGAGSSLIFAAGTNGSLAIYVSAMALGTNVATVLRLFLHDGTNYHLHESIALPETTLTETENMGKGVINLNLMIPNGWSIYASLGTTVAAGWKITCVGGNY